MTSRLMTISLKTDDYIHKNKPINVHEAQKYLEEMVSLKNRCHDERHLQLIEKLSSFMKTIIKEQSPMDTFNEDHNSPLDVPLSNLQICDKYTDGVRTENKTHNETENNIDNEQDKITSDNEDKSHRSMESERCNAREKYLHGGNMTTFSKSVVKNFENLEDRQDQQQVIEKIAKNKHAEKSLSTINMEINVDEINEQCTIKPSKGHENTMKRNFKRKTNYVEPKNKQVKTRVTKKKTETIKKTCKARNIKKNDALNITQSRISQKDSNNIENINATARLEPNLKNIGYSSLTFMSNDSNSKKKKVAIDLSWVEGIKFVREIDPQEFTNFSDINESFWDDLSLPPNMNPNDFECDNINVWKNNVN